MTLITSTSLPAGTDLDVRLLSGNIGAEIPRRRPEIPARQRHRCSRCARCCCVTRWCSFPASTCSPNNTERSRALRQCHAGPPRGARSARPPRSVRDRLHQGGPDLCHVRRGRPQARPGVAHRRHVRRASALRLDPQRGGHPAERWRHAVVEPGRRVRRPQCRPAAFPRRTHRAARRQGAVPGGARQAGRRRMGRFGVLRSSNPWSTRSSSRTPRRGSARCS